MDGSISESTGEELHFAIDAVSAFANEAGLTDGKRILLSLSKLVIVVAYALIFTKTLPEKQNPCSDSEDK